MKINREELLNALTKVKPGLAKNELAGEQTTSFAFMKDKVVTFDGSIKVSYPVKDLDIEGAVDAAYLYSFIQKLDEGEITILMKNNEIQIKQGKTKAGFKLHSEIKLPLDNVEKISKKDWFSLPEGLLPALKFVRFSASSDMLNEKFTGIHLNKKGVVEASDQLRVANYDVSELTEKLQESILIPKTSVNELVKYEVDEMAVTSSWVHFSSKDGLLFSCRLLQPDDAFPDTSGIMQIEGEEIVFPKSLKIALEKALVFINQEDPMIRITLEDNKIKLFTGKEEAAWFNQEINFKYKKSPISFHINPEFLLDILQQTNKCIISKNKAKFKQENWEYLVMLFEV